MNMVLSLSMNIDLGLLHNCMHVRWDLLGCVLSLLAREPAAPWSGQPSLWNSFQGLGLRV